MVNNKDKKLNIGVVGSGWVARMRHLPALSRNKNIIIKGIYSLNKKQAQDVASKYKGIKVCDSLEELFGLGLDALVICTSPMTHAEIAKKALLSGVHVLCEKPMTVDEKDAQELVYLAKEKNLILCPSHNFIYARAMTKAKKLINSGVAGEILSVHGTQWSSWQRELPSWYKDIPGGLFFDEGPHLVYLMQEFMGTCDLKNVSYTEKNVKDNPYQHYEIDLKGENCLGHITALYGTSSSEWFVVVVCKNMTIVLDIFRDICIKLPKEGERTPMYLMSSIIKAEKQVWAQFMDWIIYRFTKGSHLFGLDNLVNKFYDSIIYKTPPPTTPEDGLKTILLLNEIVRKSKQ